MNNDDIARLRALAATVNDRDIGSVADFGLRAMKHVPALCDEVEALREALTEIVHSKGKLKALEVRNIARRALGGSNG